MRAKTAPPRPGPVPARNPAAPAGTGTLGAPSPTDRRPTLRRPLRWLLRLLLVVAVLLVIGVAGFWWFAYSPFEGRVDDVTAIVPADVEFVYRGSWAEIRDRGWFQQHALDRPVHSDLERLRDFRETSGVATLEDRVQQGLPGAVRFLRRLVYGTDSFSVERDLVPGDVVAAGKWCPGGSPLKSGPKWPREILLLTRVSGQVKFGFEALRHEFVRRRAMPPDSDLDVVETPEGWLRVESRDPRLVPKRRETCEGGAEMGAFNVWWVLRVKDVLAVSNSEDLLRKTAEAASGSGDRAVDRPGFSMPPAEGGMSAFVDLEGLRSYLNRFFSTADGTQKMGAFLGKFLAIDTLDRAHARLVPLPSGDGILGRATVEYSADRLRAFRDVKATYDLTPTRLADGIASILPAKDTVALAQVTTPPSALFHAVYDILSKDDQRIIEGHVREIGAKRRARGEKGYDGVGEFLDELAGQLTSNTGIAVARIPSVFDAAKFDQWYLGAEPAATMALTVLVGIPPGRSADEVDKFLADRVRALDFDPPERAQTPGPTPVTYSRLPLRVRKDDGSGESVRIADLDLIHPAYFVGNGWLVLSTREDYLLEVLKTIQGGAPSVRSTRTFDAAMRDLPPDATLALYVDGEAARSLLWDHRNEVVRSRHPDDEYAKQFRVRLHEEARRAGRPIDFKTVNDAVDREVDRYRKEEYGRFVAEWRRDLDSFRRFGGVGVVLAARKSESSLDGGASLVFAPP